jgi:hypothetical protein
MSVNDAFGVRSVQRIGNLDGQRQHQFGFHRLAGNAMFQIHAIQKLHCNERLAVLVVDLEDHTDVGMVQGRGSLCFTLKTSQSLCIAGDVIWQELQSHEAVQFYVFGLVDHAHASAAELFDDAIVRDSLADQTRGALRSRLW